MSLINQMLKDLEKRRSHLREESEPIVGLYSTGKFAWPARATLFYLLGLVVIVCSTVIIYAFWPAAKTKHVLAIPQIATNTPVSAPAAAKNTTKLYPAILRDFYATGDHSNTELHIDLTQPVLYSVAGLPQQNTLTLTLENAYITEPLHLVGANKTVITNVATTPHSDGTIDLTLNLLPGTEVKSLDFTKENGTQLLLALVNHHLPSNNNLNYNKTVFSSNINGQTPYKSNSNDINSIAIFNAAANDQSSTTPLVKTAQPLTPDQIAEQNYQKALSYMQENRTADAITILRSLLNQKSEYAGVRQSLVSLLMQEQRYAEAEKILQPGLALQPHYPPFVLLKAQLGIAQQQFQAALTTLQSTTPPLQGNTDYYTVMAGLYEELGQPQFAIDLYKQLLQQDPRNAMWWMGLGICFEKIGNSEAALAAYRKASITRELNPQLQTFIDNRVQALAGDTE